MSNVIQFPTKAIRLARIKKKLDKINSLLDELKKQGEGHES